MNRKTILIIILLVVAVATATVVGAFVWNNDSAEAKCKEAERAMYEHIEKMPAGELEYSEAEQSEWAEEDGRLYKEYIDACIPDYNREP